MRLKVVLLALSIILISGANILPEAIYARGDEGVADQNTVAVSAGTDTGAGSGGEEEITSELEKWVLKLRNAGATIPVLLLLSVVGVSFILERMFVLRKKNIVPARLADRAAELWDEKKYNEIVAMCRFNKSTLAVILELIIRLRNKPVADISASAGDLASRDMRRHLLRAYPLAVIATTAPLLGLLGTVSGMVGAFDTVAMMGEMGDAGALGGDISKALVSTMVGLVVAIPALFAYHYFKSRTQYFAVMLEEEVTVFLTEKIMAGGADDES